MRGLECLQDILDAIEKIRVQSARGEKRFLSDELIQVWIAYHLQIIGEASSGLSEETRQQHAEARWARIIGMRNILVHQYFGLNLEHVWLGDQSSRTPKVNSACPAAIDTYCLPSTA